MFHYKKEATLLFDDFNGDSALYSITHQIAPFWHFSIDILSNDKELAFGYGFKFSSYSKNTFNPKSLFKPDVSIGPMSSQVLKIFPLTKEINDIIRFIWGI